MASILAAFEIKPPLDENGREYLPKIAFTSGTGRYGTVITSQIVLNTDDFYFF